MVTRLFTLAFRLSRYVVLLVAQFEHEAQLWLPLIIASALCELSNFVAPDEYLAHIKYYQAENCRFQDM